MNLFHNQESKDVDEKIQKKRKIALGFYKADLPGIEVPRLEDIIKKNCKSAQKLRKCKGKCESKNTDDCYLNIYN